MRESFVVCSRIGKHGGKSWEEALRAAETVSGEATMLAVSLDGVQAVLTLRSLIQSNCWERG